MVFIKYPILVLFILFAAVVTKQSAVSASRECCTSYTRRIIPLQAINGYSVQNGLELCSIQAIIFYTKHGTACANPALEWVNNRTKEIGRKAQNIHKLLRKRGERH